MLLELAVSDLGVIDTLTLQLPAGLIALTGETGAGKTLVVDAIDLLMGGRAHPGLVRPGATEATVDGRFELDDEEIVLTRVVPANGRSRAYINGRPATVSALADVGANLVDLHGQHAHQSLLGVEAQRAALDQFGRVNLDRLVACRKLLRDLETALVELGGDERTRARELDLLRYQVRELDDATLKDPDEDVSLAEAEDLLANAVEHREAADSALTTIADDDGIRDRLADATARLTDRPPFVEVTARLKALLAELDDISDTVRVISESIDQDPAALADVQERRHLLHQLCRKYGDDLHEVIAEHAALRERLVELEGHDERAARLDTEVLAAGRELADAEAEVLAARLEAAPMLADAIASHLPDLAMEKAEVGIEVDGVDGSQVVFLLAANPGSALQPLSKVASGGELARAMLALRSVLSEAPPILVFDEVDAGIGGQAGLSIGRSLAALGDRHQVLVVTHLPQVAAFADAHLAVEKRQGEDDTVSEVRLLNNTERRTELARMLSGQPESKTARKHAKELLAEAAAQKLR
jgi:DNA repair protein RecN (Recombination protein N)